MSDPAKGDEILLAMAATYKERNALYGANYVKVGEIMAILFPDGITVKTVDDHVRFHLLTWMIGKLTRMTPNWHKDSIHDLPVYGALLEGWIKHVEKGKDGP